MSLLQFKFRPVKDGRPRGLRARAGSLGDEGLQLGQSRIAFAHLQQTAVRDNRLVLALSAGAQLEEDLVAEVQGELLVLDVYGGAAPRLKRALDQQRSALRVAARREELQAAGEGGSFRSVSCPVCSSSLDLSGAAAPALAYCPYCESIVTGSGALVTDGGRYTVCSDCGFFGRVQGYPEFYFYFLLVLYGFSYKRRFLCDGCARGLFVKTLLINLVFVLGVFPALWVGIKRLTGRDPRLGQLAQAAKLSAKGRVAEAAPLYQAMLARLPDHPGLLFDQAMGQIEAGDTRAAASSLQRCLAACPSYLPAYRLLAGLQAAAARGVASQS